MTVSVRLFARARDLAGIDKLTLTFSGPVTVAALRTLLLERYPTLQPLGKSLLVAVDADYAPDDRVLSADNEVAFFPPVSGG